MGANTLALMKPKRFRDLAVRESAKKVVPVARTGPRNGDSGPDGLDSWLSKRARRGGGYRSGRAVVVDAVVRGRFAPWARGRHRGLLEHRRHHDQGYFAGTDQASVNRGVADLSATGMFANVSAKIVDGKMIVTVSESGADHQSRRVRGQQQAQGRPALRSKSNRRAAPASTSAKANADIDRIKEAYKKFGRNEAQVSYRLVHLPNGRVDLVFKVDEGRQDRHPRDQVRRQQGVLRTIACISLMQTTTMNFLSWFKTSDVYDPDRLASDEEAIRKYYMKNGYADFRITNTDVAYQDDPARLRHHDHDGRGRAVPRLRREGDVAYRRGRQRLAAIASSSCSRATSTTRPRSTVDGQRRSPARWRGRATPSRDVRPHGERDEATHQIALAFTVDDGPKVYIERIDIVGNTRTRDYVIRREFDIGEGDPYNHAMIERGERRLNRLGYFKKVHISTRPGSTPDRVIVIVEVEDQPTGSISLERRLFDDRRLPRRSRVHRDQLPRPRPIRAASASPTASTAAAGACRSPSPISSISGSPPASTSSIKVNRTRTRAPITSTGRPA